MADDYDSGDDLFDGLNEDALLQSSQAQTPAKRPLNESDGNAVSRAQSDENPSKRPRIGNSDTDGGSSSSSKLALATSILKENFGYPAFRHEQAAAIERILHGENSLVVFPTGAGKSLCYQIPAIAFEAMDRETGDREEGDSGVTIIVSPLIALMKDQVDALQRRGIAAECIDSTKSWEQIQDINASLRSGKLRMIYCAPERLNNEMFVENMKYVRGGVRLLAVDEAHSADVLSLRLEAVATSKQEEKRDLLLAYLKEHRGSTLVYVTQQRQAEDLALDLKKQGFKVQAFHAGMKTEEKTRIQDAFMASKVDIVVATIAFGMGIDKSDIRSIIHWDLSNTVEEYCQQVGRAGRDGKESHCMLYLCPEDFYVKEAFARGDLPSRQSLRGLLKDIFSPEVLSLSVGDTFKTSHHPQTTEFDIRMSPLSIIYAALELRFKLIRAITPEYSSYTFEANNVYYPRLKNDKSPEAAAILNNAKKAKKYHSIDPTAVSKSTGIRRNDLIKYLNKLNDTGCIKLKVSGVQNKYKILSKLPGTDREIDELVEKVYADLELREQQALDRTQQLIKLVTAKKCFALSLAQHFGMELPGQATQCGHCTFCVTKKAVELPAPARKPFDFEAAEKVLEATDVRDDPRFLARVAFGIKSPRVTRLGLDKKKIFASMAESDFEALLAEFTKVCK
ncbi:ATP-dependent DNA helicase recQ [Verticillium alfalfae VaMs.102]|uniref:DNA 3'-5' helicase n=1 Tax=Verticillium alfalfae (strain VaMs.102 / ATCC MYA-4576 / FGSC 10136) TaxID=526221 RepID=C9SRZ9_VERA1|nr:ATP-dependent DNA helicase recQ [Verticillium alfalfae VaMs.102]EEY21564.1 ATP-dependent DNA helicase recQ [Verticillium alfalfae VaMs.102]